MDACRLAAIAIAFVTAGCGAKSPLIVPDVVHAADVVVDVPADTACVPSTEVCNNRDDDCNGLIDDFDPRRESLLGELPRLALAHPVNRDPSESSRLAAHGTLPD